MHTYNKMIYYVTRKIKCMWVVPITMYWSHQTSTESDEEAACGATGAVGGGISTSWWKNRGDANWQVCGECVGKGFSQGCEQFTRTVCLVVALFTVIVTEPFSCVTIHKPVHCGSSFPPAGFHSSTCCPTSNCLPSEPPYATCFLFAAWTMFASTISLSSNSFCCKQAL